MQRTICLSASLQCSIFYAVCLNLGFIDVKKNTNTKAALINDIN